MIMKLSRKTRLTLIIVGLVILPTAFLSMLAGSVLWAQRLLLMHEVQSRAVSGVSATVRQINSILESKLHEICSVITTTIESGGKYSGMKLTADRITNSSPLVKQVYLFMNPWGFLYPQSSTEDKSEGLRAGWDYLPAGKSSSTEKGEDPVLEQLASVLRREITSAGENDIIRFKFGDSFYYFAPIRERKLLYAGYETEKSRLNNIIQQTLELNSASGFFLTIFGVDRIVPDRVIAVDSLSPERTEPARYVPESDELKTSEILAAGKLAYPLNDISIFAISRGSDELVRMGRFHQQLHLWGIILLAGGICLGVGMIIREGVVEIKRARERMNFVIGVSHDLRTPLSSMRMLAESLHLGHVTDPAKQKQFSGMIMKEADRLARLIERTLLLVRIEQNALTHSMKTLNPADIVKAAVQCFESGLPTDKKISTSSGASASSRFKMQFSNNLPAVTVDETAINQCLFNLLDNAIKYSPPDSPVEINVDTVTRRKKVYVRISIRDYGYGIPEKYLRRIFKPFYRVPSSGGNKQSDQVFGVGLGLALCKHIVDAHGGRIEVESKPGAGSTFSVLLKT
jgi:signal transduction histidine kinase